MMDATLRSSCGTARPSRRRRAATLPATAPALPAAVPAPDAEPAPEAAEARTPPRPVVEGRHARRVRERAERHAARAKAAGLARGRAGR